MSGTLSGRQRAIMTEAIRAPEGTPQGLVGVWLSRASRLFRSLR